MNVRMRLPIAGLFLLAALLASDDKVKLPPPYATPSANNAPHVVERPEGSELKMPEGFQVDIYAEGFEQPRFMALGPSGELLVSDSIKNGAVYVLEGEKERKKLIGGLDRPYGLSFWKDYLYVGEETSVKRYKYDASDRSVGQGEEVI